MSVRLPRQQLRRTLADPLGVLTAQKAAVVEKELQRGQVIWAQLSAQKK